MKRTSSRRLRKVSKQIEAMPIDPKVEQAAYDRFRETGELPVARVRAMAASRLAALRT